MENIILNLSNMKGVINMKVKVFSTSSYTKNDKQKYVGYFLTDFGGNIAVNKVITDVELHDNDLIEVAKSKQYGTYFIPNKK